MLSLIDNFTSFVLSERWRMKMQGKEKEIVSMIVGEGETVVACSDKSMKIGATMWDLKTGQKLLHIPSCVSSPFGFVCLKNRFLVASQLNKHGSVGGGAITIWSFNKVTFSHIYLQHFFIWNFIKYYSICYGSLIERTAYSYWRVLHALWYK